MHCGEENERLIYDADVCDPACEGSCAHPPSCHADNCQERVRNTARGASAIIGSWPDHLNPPCRIGIGLFFCLLGGVILVLGIYYVTSVMVPGAIPVPRRLVKREARSGRAPRSVSGLEERCGDKDEEDFRARQDEIRNDLLPLETQARFAKDVSKVFFVKDASKPLTSEEICALQTAKKFHGDSTYLIVVKMAENATRSDEATVLEELSRNHVDMKTNVMFTDTRGYLKSTILEDLHTVLENMATGQEVLMMFAIKLLTLWRYSGSAYSLGLLTLKQPPVLDHPGNINTTLSSDGDVMAVRDTCHTVVFELMKAMIALESTDTVPSVILNAKNRFCGSSSNRQDQGCSGMHILDKNMLCTAVDLTTNNKTEQCVWAKINMNHDSDLWRNNCVKSK